VFRGKVHVIHPQMDWTCERLSVLSLPAGGKVVFAEHAVVFDLWNPEGQKTHGTGDRAFYTNSLSGPVTNDLLTLVGTPATLAVTNRTTLTNGAFGQNAIIIFDRITGKVTAPGGAYKFVIPASPVDSNTFLLQKKKALK
jgi:hypothetical protein